MEKIKDSNLSSFVITIELKTKKKKNFKTCGSIREDFNPNNVAMNLWLVFIKYIYTWEVMATWSHY